MVMFIPWRKSENFVYVLLFLAISSIIQLIFIISSFYLLPISSYFVLFLVPMAAIIVIAAAMVILSDFIYQFRYIRTQNKVTTESQEEVKYPSKIISILFATFITVGFYVLLYLGFSYVFLDPIVFYGVPTFGRYIINHNMSALLLLIIFAFLKDLQESKRIT